MIHVCHDSFSPPARESVFLPTIWGDQANVSSCATPGCTLQQFYRTLSFLLAQSVYWPLYPYVKESYAQACLSSVAMHTHFTARVSICADQSALHFVVPPTKIVHFVFMLPCLWVSRKFETHKTLFGGRLMLRIHINQDCRSNYRLILWVESILSRGISSRASSDDHYQQYCQTVSWLCVRQLSSWKWKLKGV